MRKKWNFYVKVLVIETDELEVQPEKLSREITRKIEQIYGVRHAEITNVVTE
jgi:hypothetical protein